MSEIEIKKFVRRSRAGKRNAAAAGNVVIGGQVQFGYTRDVTGKKLVKDKPKAKHNCWMFTQFNKGKKIAQPKDDWIGDKIPAIVAETSWNAAQK